MALHKDGLAGRRHGKSFIVRLAGAWELPLFLCQSSFLLPLCYF